METRLELIGLLGRHAFDAGTAYARAGRATVQLHDRVDCEVAGTCVGSGGRVYEAVVTYEVSRNGVLRGVEGRCSCPVTFDCKHAVALLLTALDREDSSAHLRRGAGRESWRDALEQALPAAGRGEGLGLAFDFYPPAQGRRGPEPGRLLARPVRPGRRAAWVSTGATWTNIRAGIVAEADPRHVAVLEKLRDLQAAGDPYRYGEAAWLALDEISYSEVWPVLREVVAAGVTLLDVTATGTAPAPRPPAVVLEPEAATAPLQVQAERSGEIVVTAGLHHPRLHPADTVLTLGQLPHGLAWVADGALHLAPLAPPATASWLALRRRATGIRVPADERAAFEREFAPRILAQEWTSPDETFEPPPPPVPRLHVELRVEAPAEIGDVPRGVVGWGWRYDEPDDAAEPGSAAAGFGAEPGPDGADTATAVLADDRSTWLPVVPPLGTLERDVAAEAEILGGVADILAHVPALLDPPTIGPWGKLAVVAPMQEAVVTGHDVVLLSSELLAALTDLGVRVHHGALPRFRVVEQSRVAVAVTAETRDWFELEVTMTVGDHEVPIGYVISALAGRQRMLFLPNGTYVSLDQPELDQLRELIAESRALTDHRRAALRVPRVRKSWWEELLSLGVVQTAEHEWFEALRRASTDPPPLPPLPRGLVAELRPYQQDGFGWLAQLRRAGLGGVLADDMGLGKTVQAIAMILDEREDDGGAAPVDVALAAPRPPWLVVAPTSVVPNWAAEVGKFAPGLRVAVVDSTAARRKDTLAELAAGADVIVTSYTLLRLEQDDYAALDLAGLVLDEAQNAKNHTSKVFASAKSVGAPVTFAITGTPMENNLSELWAMFALVAPGLLGTPQQFTELYRRPIERSEDAGGRMIGRLRRRIAPFLLRRTKEEVATDLPPKQEQVLRVDLEPAHRKIYDRHLQRERNRVLRLADDLERNRVEILAALTRLRQLAIDPALVEEDTLAPSSKLEVLIPLLVEAAAEGHRVLVFSQFTRFLRTIARRLEQAGLGYSYLDGSTTRRAQVIDGFATGTDPVFLISLKAGGVGLNLTMADYAILADPWWNPAAEAQAVDRAHRIGQTRPVMVYRLVAAGTIEDKVMALQDSKRALVAGVLGPQDEDPGATVAALSAAAEAAGPAEAATADGQPDGVAATTAAAPPRGRRSRGGLSAEELRALLS